MNADKLNRPSANPGGMECQTCGRIFIGDESHSECGFCHNTRPTAVASHAEWEVVAWRWRDDVRPGLPWKTTTDADVIDQLRAKGGYEIEPLYLHPPRSGDDARDAANLMQFVHAIFQATDWPYGGDLDGFEFQEIAVKCGLLEEVEMKDPCGDACHCYDMGADFPSRCFRKTKLYYTCAAMAARGGE